MNRAGDSREGSANLLVCSFCGFVEVDRHLPIVGVVKPSFVRGVASNSIAFTTGSNQVVFSSGAPFLPKDQMVDGKRGVVVTAVPTLVPISLKDLPSDVLVYLSLTFTDDCLTESPIFGLSQNLRFEKIRLLQETHPVILRHLDGLQGQVIMLPSPE